MTFDRLPTEVKEEIIQLVHLADQAYRRRFQPLPPLAKGYNSEAIEGKGLLMLSRTFHVPVQPHTDDEPPAREAIRTFLRGNLPGYFTRLTRMSGHWNFAALVWLDVLDHLPNLKHLGLGSGAVQLVSDTGPRCLPESKVFPHELSFAEQDRRIREKFLKLARQITSWSFEMDVGDAEKILRFHRELEKVERLSLKPARGYHSSCNRFLEETRSTFPSLLSRLPNLKVLRIENYASPRDPEYPEHPHFYLETFRTSYPFAATLESLTLSFNQALGSRDGNQLSLLIFAGLFPSLRHLDLRHTKHELTSEETSNRRFRKLPNLENFEFNCCNLDSTLVLLRFLDLPSLQHLTITFSLDILSPRDLASDSPFFVQLLQCLKDFKNLRSVYLEADRRSGIPSETVNFLRRSLSDQAVEIKVDTLEGVVEAMPVVERWNRVDPRKYEQIDSKETLEALTNGAEDLGKWVQRRAQELRGSGDIVGAVKLMQGLLGVAEIKQEWDD